MSFKFKAFTSIFFFDLLSLSSVELCLKVGSDPPFDPFFSLLLGFELDGDLKLPRGGLRLLELGLLRKSLFI